MTTKSVFQELRLRIARKIDDCEDLVANHDCDPYVGAPCLECNGHTYAAAVLKEILRGE